MILIYRKVSISWLVRKAMIRILKAASLEVFGLIEKYGYEGKTPMVCSQFVYECFAKPSERDKAYRLQLEEPLLRAVAAEERLLDELIHHPTPTALHRRTFDEGVGADLALDPEDLARELVMALAEEEPESEA